MSKRLLVGVMVLLSIGAGLTWAAQPAPKKAYLVARIDVQSPATFEAYRLAAPAIVEQFGGRYLARGGKVVTLEGAPGPSRVTVIEFASMERAEAFYNSPAYVAARKLREGAATASFTLVEGL